jgi:hypothetical protein
MEDQGEPLEYGPEPMRVIRKAVDAERRRMKDFQRSSATTEQGKGLQHELGGSRSYIDAIVEQAAAGRLRRYKPARNQTKLNHHNGNRLNRNTGWSPITESGPKTATQLP